MPATTPTQSLPTAEPPRSPWRQVGALELLTAAVLLGGPIFYVLGRIYWESYWVRLGITPSVMTAEPGDYIYYGFITLASGITMVLPRGDNLAVWSAPLAAAVLLVVLVAFFWLIGKVKLNLSRHIKKHRRRLRLLLAKSKPVLKSIDRAATCISVLSTLALALLLLSGALLVPIVLAHEVGTARAAKVIEDLAEPKSAYALVQVDGINAGRLLECKVNYCAIYHKGKLRPVPIESIRWGTAE